MRLEKGDRTPVYRKDDKNVKENYMPVTVLSCKQFGHHIGDGVKAYQNHKSRETTLISLVEDWKLAVDNRLLEGILSTDMPKAFDSLHPPIMPRKLQSYGFQDRALDLLRSYLGNRLGRGRIGSVTSSCRGVERGCPQNPC